MTLLSQIPKIRPMRFSIVAAFLIVLCACENGGSSGNSLDVGSVDAEESLDFDEVSSRDSSLLSASEAVLTLMKERNFEGLSRFIHPELGIRFSPYGHVDTAAHVRLTRQQFLQLKEEEKPVLWGNYDGTGKDIQLTFEEYFEKFVYDVDFLNPEQTSVNEILGQGNTLHNLETVYPGADFTESYFSGFEEKYDGMDWRSLRLVFQSYEGRPYLVGIVHDQWTI